MLGQGVQRHRERCSDVGDSRLAGHEAIEDRAAGGIGQGCQDVVEHAQYSTVLMKISPSCICQIHRCRTARIPLETPRQRGLLRGRSAASVHTAAMPIAGSDLLKPTVLSLCVALGTACGTASCAPIASTAAEVSSAPASASARARAVPAACAAQAASAPHVDRTPTSKLRHIPDEGEPCADSRGVAMPPTR